jgi:hypothetical protein
MRLSRIFALLFFLLLMQCANANEENWVFLGISSVDMSTDYYDANQHKKRFGFFLRANR